MAACRQSIELESKGLQLSRYFTISEACKPPHLRSDDDRKLSALTRRRKLRHAASLSPSFEQLSSVSATVRPCATRPGSSSEVATYGPSGNCSTCIRIASSMLFNAISQKSTSDSVYWKLPFQEFHGQRTAESGPRTARGFTQGEAKGKHLSSRIPRERYV